MTNLFRIACLLWAFAGLSACGGSFYNEHQPVEGVLVWKKGEVKTFKVEVSDVQSSYELVAALRHHSSIKYSALEIGVIISGPNGFSHEGLYKIPLRDAEGYLVGSAAGDLCDTETTLETHFKFPTAGEYTISVAPALETEDKIENIMEVGFIIDVQEE